MEYTFFLLYLFVVLPDQLIHFFYLSLEGRVEIIFDVVVASFLKTFGLKKICQNTPFMGVLAKKLKESLVLFLSPMLEVFEDWVEVILPSGLVNGYRSLHCLLDRSEACLGLMCLTISLNSLEMCAHLILEVLVTRDRRS